MASLVKRKNDTKLRSIGVVIKTILQWLCTAVNYYIKMIAPFDSNLDDNCNYVKPKTQFAVYR